MTHKGWHPEDIKAAIRKTGITLSALSLKAGLGESTVRQAILYRHCPAGERAIIEHLGADPHEIWPDRYDTDGNRIIGRTPVKYRRQRPGTNSQKGAVA